MRPIILIAVFGMAATYGESCAAGMANGNGTIQSRYSRYPVPPVDEGPQEASFDTFRDQFVQAVVRRDASAVVDSIDPSRTVGLETLRASLERGLAIPHHEYWFALDRAIKRGGSFTTTRGAQQGRREFCSPYTFSSYPRPRPLGFQGELEPWVINGSEVPVHTEPKTNSPSLAELSNELVEVNGNQEPADNPRWYGVVLEDGREGWVSSAQILDPEDYHACFAQIGGRWLLTDLRKGLPRW